MQSLPLNSMLKFNPTTFRDVRKCWNLEKEGRMEEAVKILQEWVNKQNHFKNKNFDPRYLEANIITCKGSLEKAKRQIDRVCTLRTLLPRFFVGGDVRKTLGEFVDIIWMALLPKLTDDHYRILLIKGSSNPFTSDHFINFYQNILLLGMYALAHDYANGFIVIIDYRETNILDVISKMSLVELQQFMSIIMEGFGARIKGIHLLTESKAVDILIKTVKTVLSAKVGERMQTHNNLEKLHKLVDKKLLPLEYGGEQGPMSVLQNQWLDALSSEKNESYLADLKTFCTDESLRSADKYNEEIMGLPGSFRSLKVD